MRACGFCLSCCSLTASVCLLSIILQALFYILFAQAYEEQRVHLCTGHFVSRRATTMAALALAPAFTAAAGPLTVRLEEHLGQRQPQGLIGSDWHLPFAVQSLRASQRDMEQVVRASFSVHRRQGEGRSWPSQVRDRPQNLKAVRAFASLCQSSVKCSAGVQRASPKYHEGSWVLTYTCQHSTGPSLPRIPAPI